MNVAAPHFLLFSESREIRSDESGDGSAGQWRFVLEAVDGSDKLEAADEEPDAYGERLELLAVVRGLEALDQPSRVTLITSSRYVARGLRSSLPEWRSSGWQWERFGEMRPVKNEDLWRRVDCALKYHQVDCRTWKFAVHEEPSPTPAEDQTGRHLRMDPPHDSHSHVAAACDSPSESLGATPAPSSAPTRRFGRRLARALLKA